MPQGNQPATGIFTALRLLRHRYGRWLALELFARTALVCAVVGYAAFALSPVAGNGWRLVLLGVLALGVVLSIALLRNRFQPFRSEAGFSRFLQAKLPGSRQDFETALALESQQFADETTAALAARHRRRAQDRLAGVPKRVLRSPFHSEPATAAAVLWGAAACLFLLYPAKFTDAADRWFRWDGQGAKALSALSEGEKIFAEFSFEITPPAYTGLQQDGQTGLGETLRAYKGSSVRVSVALHGNANEKVRLLLPGGGAVSLIADGDAFVGDFAVTQGGRFILEVLRDGVWISDATERTIEILPDEAPFVTITEPADEREFNPNDVFDLAYDATDDFGFTKANLVVEAGGAEQRFSLAVSTGALRYQASKRVHVGEWDVPEGGPLQYYVEVYDNDTVSGPKRGTSERQTAKISSPRTKHRELLERMDKLADQVINVLADMIDLPDAFSKIPIWKRLEGTQLRIGEAGTEFAALAAALQDDSLADAGWTVEFEGLGRRFARFGTDVGSYAARVTAGTAAPVYTGFRTRGVEEMEEISLALLDLIRRGRLSEVLATSQAIESARDELKRLMEAYRKNPTDELREAMRRKVAEIQRLMAELARQQMAMAESLPEEFYNTDAFEKSREEDPAGQIPDLQKALESADPDQLLAAMERFDKSLDSMLSNLDKAGRQATRETGNDSYRQLSQALEEVKELEQGQQKLTEEMRKKQASQLESAAQAARELQKEVAQALAKLNQEVGELEQQGRRSPLWNRGFRSLSPRAQEELKKAKRAVQAGDWETARRSTQMAESYLQSMKNQADFDAQAGIGGQLSKKLQDGTGQAVAKAREIREKLQQPGQAGGDGEAQQELDDLQSAQRKLEERLDDLRRRLEAKEGSAPMPKESRKALEGGQNAMKEAQQKMEGNQAAGAADKAEEAAERLAEARQSMNDLKEQMEQQMSAPGGQGSEGPQSAGRSQPDEKVEIPRTTAEKSDRRQEVLKGMREGLPEAYEELNRRYYDKLVR